MTGPQGIGKSHTLVALVMKYSLLGRDSPYHMTFVPQCAKWDTILQFLDYILTSFGTTRKAIHWDTNEFIRLDADGRQYLVDEVISLLSEKVIAKNKKWVFIFDHVFFGAKQRQKLLICSA